MVIGCTMLMPPRPAFRFSVSWAQVQNERWNFLCVGVSGLVGGCESVLLRAGTCISHTGETDEFFWEDESEGKVRLAFAAARPVIGWKGLGRVPWDLGRPGENGKASIQSQGWKPRATARRDTDITAYVPLHPSIPILVRP